MRNVTSCWTADGKHVVQVQSQIRPDMLADDMYLRKGGWSESETAKAYRMQDEGHNVPRIAAAIGRTEPAIRAKQRQRRLNNA